MFIERVTKAKNSDRWYSKQDRILNPQEAITSSGYSYKDVYEHFFKTGRYTTKEESLIKMIEGFNPKYKSEDAKFVRGISVIIAVKYYGMEEILNKVLVELEI